MGHMLTLNSRDRKIPDAPHFLALACNAENITHNYYYYYRFVKFTDIKQYEM